MIRESSVLVIVGLAACVSVGPGVDRDDPGAVCLARALLHEGLVVGDAAASCPRDALRVTPRPSEDCQNLRAYEVDGCRLEPDSAPITGIRWIEVVGDECVAREDTAGICFE